MTPEVQVRRRMVFSAAHRLHHAELDNDSIFGKCANLHGHNYVVEVIVRGPVDPLTGYVIDLKELKDIMNEKIMLQLDHKNIDSDVSWFRNKVQSAENIAIFIWEQIEPAIKRPARLQCVKLFETENNIVEYFG